MSYPWFRFKDGVIYHDRHFNGMQIDIARDQKRAAVMAHYESVLLIHQWAEYLWVDPLVDDSQIQSLSGVTLSDEDLSAALESESGTLVWKSIALAYPVEQVELLWSADVPDGASLNIQATFDGGLTWVDVSEGEPVTCNPTQSVRLRSLMDEGPGGVKPRLYHLAMFW